ncbi:MAG: TPM domain-containing protein [Chthoniobacterales bacterium]
MARALSALLLLIASGRAADIPRAPGNHVYDPDFLVTREATGEISNELTKFQTSDDMSVYLAVLSATSQLIEETAEQLNQAWDQSGYGVAIVFVPREREARVGPSPQFSLVVTAEKLSTTFRRASLPALKRGDDSAAARDGTHALLKHLAAVRVLHVEPQATPFRLTRGWWLAILGCGTLAGLVLLWFAARHWRQANLFGHRYRFPEATTPAALCFGATRCGGRMATMRFRASLKSEDV